MEAQNRTPSESEMYKLLVAKAGWLEAEISRSLPASCKGIISADDILQDVWIAAFKGRSSFRNDRLDALERWLRQVTNRKVLDVVRVARRQKRGGGRAPFRHRPSRVSSWGDFLDRVESGQRTPSREVSVKERERALRIALCGLPDDYRRVLRLRYLEGKSNAETAELMSRSVPAIRDLVFKGKRALRRQMGSSSMFFTDA